MDTTRKRLRSIEEIPVNGKTKDEPDVDYNGIDRISNLPDDILCHILSFVPTKYAVATSILSTKWRNLVPKIPNLRLELDDTLQSHPESDPDAYLLSFRNFVTKLLSVTLLDVPSIDSLSLICKKFDDGQTIAHWISAALHLNVKIMDLLLHGLRNSNFFFDSLYGCNMGTLNLSLDIADDASEYRFSLPNLKKLFVHHMKFNVINALLESCPSLACLLVYHCYGETLHICIPSLRVLMLHTNCAKGSELELDAPELLYLTCLGYLPKRCTIKKLKSLQCASLYLEPYQSDIQYEFDQQAFELITACCNAQELRLSDEMMAMVYFYAHPLPQFQKLVTLKIDYIGERGWDLLKMLLACAPILNYVLMEDGYDDESYEEFKVSLKEPLSICVTTLNETCILLKFQRKDVPSIYSL